MTTSCTIFVIGLAGSFHGLAVRVERQLGVDPDRAVDLDGAAADHDPLDQEAQQHLAAEAVTRPPPAATSDVLHGARRCSTPSITTSSSSPCTARCAIAKGKAVRAPGRARPSDARIDALID
jgi:hypothetical protein